MRVAEFANERDPARLCDRLARPLRDDSTVRLAWLHGSRARGTARRESDIDVAVPLGDEAERMRGWAGFRNVLVHDYIGIDHRIAYAAIRDELDDLVAFRIRTLGKVAP